MKPLTCESNEYYGHGHILRSYAGIDSIRRLRGRIQHGWTIRAIVLADEIALHHEPFYAWADRDAQALARRFHTNTLIIGAPALYDDSLWQIGESGRHALAIPAHSLAAREIIADWRLYAQELVAWRKAHGQEVRVLLYIRDYERDDVRAVFGANEIPQVCAGEITNVDFLLHLFMHIKSAQLVLTNCIQTVCFYALMANRPVQFYGSSLGIEAGLETQAEFQLLQDVQFISRVFPSIYAGRPDRDLGMQHLGAEFQRSSDEIRNLEWL